MANSNGLTQTLCELEEELKRLKAAADHISDAREAATNAAEVAGNLVESSATLANAAEALTSKIDGVDFPTRLDKLDATVSSINLGLQNVQSRLEGVERSLSDELKASREALLKEMKELAEQQSTLQKRVKQNGILLIVIAVLALVVLVLQLAL